MNNPPGAGPQSEAQRALDEIADALCKHLGPQVLHQDIADVDDAVIAEHEAFRNDMLQVAAHIAAIPTLRAALSPPADDITRDPFNRAVLGLDPVPPADDEISAIRARHEERMHFSTQPPPQIAADFATLLRAVDRLSAELAKERERRGGWQPIETAPRDGTRIILAWGGASVVGFYLDNTSSSHPWGWQGWQVPSMEPTPRGLVTHWRPLPTPPATITKETP